ACGFADQVRRLICETGSGKGSPPRDREHFFRRPFTARQSSGNGAGLASRIRRFTSEEQCVIDRLGQHSTGTSAADGDIAVRSPRQWIGSPVIGVESLHKRRQFRGTLTEQFGKRINGGSFDGLFGKATERNRFRT